MNKRNFLHNNTTLRQCKNTMLLTQITDKNQLWLHLSELSHASLIHKLSHYTSRLHYITSLLRLMQFWGFLLFSCTFLTPQQTKAMFSELKFVFTEPYFIPSGRKSKSYNCHYMFSCCSAPTITVV